MIFPLFHHLFLCQSKTCVAHPKSIMCFVLTLRLHQLSDFFTRGTECVRIWTFSLTVCSPNQISLFRPAMRSLLKTANNNTCSIESQDASVKLTESLVQHFSDSTHMQLFQKWCFPILSHLWEICYQESTPFAEFTGTSLSGCDQSLCVVKWGVECLFKLVVSYSEALSDQWHDSCNPWDGRCDLSEVSSKMNTTHSLSWRFHLKTPGCLLPSLLFTA